MRAVPALDELEDRHSGLGLSAETALADGLAFELTFKLPGVCPDRIAEEFRVTDGRAGRFLMGHYANVGCSAMNSRDEPAGLRSVRWR